MSRATYWLAAAAVAFALGASPLLDAGPDEVQAAQDAADDLVAAQVSRPAP